MGKEDYHKKIVDYYNATENAYKDSWDLDNSLSIHYGYWDEHVRSFAHSLQRMNEVMAEAAQIKPTDAVLDAGCGVGGSSIFLGADKGCKVTGITLSERQAAQATSNAKQRDLDSNVNFMAMDYCATTFPDKSFDVVWGCESVCYAESKDKFIKEAFRLLRPGGRLVVADGFVSSFENNDEPVIREWLNGWQVNYLESPSRFKRFMTDAGFTGIDYRDISGFTVQSSRRLLRYYYLGSLYVKWKKLIFSNPPTDMQIGNIKACRHQYRGMKRRLWQYGLITGKKP